jgi:hypothetical protein
MGSSSPSSTRSPSRVTEEITGQDLVEWQLRVASGEKLPKRQDELSINGHAIEARLYAEEPAKGFLPSVGRLDHFDLGAEGRIETGVEEGDEISPFYDPMIAKLIGTGGTRDEAIEELASMLASVEVWPVRTNAGFLFNAVVHPEFDSAAIDTGFIERNLNTLVPDSAADETIRRAAAAVAILAAKEGNPVTGLAGFGHQFLRRVLEAHGADAVRLRPDPYQPGVDHRLSEVGVLAEETVAGVNRLRAGLLCGLDDPVSAQVRLARRTRPDVHHLVRHAHVQRLGVSIRINRDGANAEPPRGADHAARDLAAIGDEQRGYHV